MSHMQEVEDPVGEDDATSVRARLPEGTDECVTCDNLAHDRDSRHICASLDLPHPTRRASLRNVAPLVRWNYGSVERYALNDRTG